MTASSRAGSDPELLRSSSSSSPFVYAPEPGAHDEAFGADGTAHAHCAELIGGLASLGVSEVQARWERARRLIRDNGVTYNVYGDPRGMDRPWELDAVPLVVTAPDWARLARGLAERAELLNRVLADLYGEQTLLARGVLPPELVLGSPGFLRALHGVATPGGTFLHVLATDLARGRDGSFVVLGDRTQTPSGAGYALENRIVLSRSLPDLFRDSHVQRLAGYFRTLRDTLRSLAPRARESPRVVLLTPGPHNETYFEHAYLARYLGIALVEGADLTVRERRVYMKTLRGLERVDVILRRLDDAFSDPLSLRPDSSLGVAGLVHAVRAGNVAVANALGSGLVETPALLAFLPRIARELLGHDLALPSVGTFWCGDPDSLAHVLSNLDRLVIKPTFWAQGTFEPVFARRLSASDRDDLVQRLRARPEAFVAQEEVELSTAPSWSGTRLEPRHVALRAFVTHSPNGYQTMPGGLARVAATQESLVVSMQRGAGSKDLWVLASPQDVSPVVSLLRSATQPLEVVRSGGDLPSRVADNLFWFGRYLERAEGSVRLLRSLLARLTDESIPGHIPELPSLLRAAEVNAELEAGLLAETAERSPAKLDAILAELLFAGATPHSLRATVTAGHRAGSTVRDRLSADMWRVVSRMKTALDEGSRAPRFRLAEAFDLVGELVPMLAALTGLSMENMTHGPGWRFADMGRRVERLYHTVRLLRALLVPVSSDDGPTLEALLEIADSVITYRTRYLGTLQVPLVLDLLLTDETNPRSAAYQLVTLGEHIEKLPRADVSAIRPEESRIVLRGLSQVQVADVRRLSLDSPRQALDALLAELEAAAPRLAESLTRSYLTHAQPLQSLDGRS